MSFVLLYLVKFKQSIAMDLFNIMGKLKEMQEKMKQAQAHLQEVKAEGEAGAGLVKAHVNGLKQVLKVEVDASLLAEDQKEVLQDLIVAAVNVAMAKAEEAAQEYLQKTMKESMPNIPGLDFLLNR
ncbi:YbaB/EbfC family nucleoid-associated protein [Thermonema lapsum]|nr:YbaB/EbfC family nucleoid-associated protein [Thermonema lapsum]